MENKELDIAILNRQTDIKTWHSVKDKLPAIDVEVLMYHEIETINEGIVPYIEIGCVSSWGKTNNNREAEWIDKEYNRLASPSHWMPLPAPPVERQYINHTFESQILKSNKSQ